MPDQETLPNPNFNEFGKYPKRVTVQTSSTTEDKII